MCSAIVMYMLFMEVLNCIFMPTNSNYLSRSILIICVEGDIHVSFVICLMTQ